MKVSFRLEAEIGGKNWITPRISIDVADGQSIECGLASAGGVLMSKAGKYLDDVRKAQNSDDVVKAEEWLEPFINNGR
jgi:hypothetical protein